MHTDSRNSHPPVPTTAAPRDAELASLRQLLAQHDWAVTCDHQDDDDRIVLEWLWADEFEQFLSIVAGKRDGHDSPLCGHVNVDGDGIVGAGVPEGPTDWFLEFYLSDISSGCPDEATDIRLRMSIDIPPEHLPAIEDRLRHPPRR
jgi:hypothetical protein